MLLGVQNVFWTPKYVFVGPNNFFDAQKSFWTSKHVFRPWEPAFFGAYIPETDYAQCLSDITAPPNSYDKK